MTLSMLERARLAEALIASLDDSGDQVVDVASLDRAWQDEAARRAAECHAGTAPARPASAVFSSTRKRIGEP